MSYPASFKLENIHRIKIPLEALLAIAPYAKGLNLLKSRVKMSQTGSLLSKIQGKGMQFVESRHYQKGDDIRSIDWKTTARAASTHTKVFAEEREVDVFLVIDARSSMHFATEGLSKIVQAGLTASYLAWSAFFSHYRMGYLIIKDDKELHFSCPRLGKKALYPFLETISQLGDEKERTFSSKTPLCDALSLIDKKVKSSSLIFMLTDFRGISLEHEAMILRLANQHQLFFCFIYDRFEKKLPKNFSFSVTDGHSEKKITNSHAFIEAYQQAFSIRKNLLLKLSENPHLHFLELSTKDHAFEKLKNYFY